MTDLSPEQTLLRDADRCVMCGMCLPHCPTYALTEDETESPRGRISMIQGLARGELRSERALEHLDHCLLCRACEAMCPSEVRYGQLMVNARRQFHREHPHSRSDRAVQAMVDGRLPRRLARTYQRSGLQALARTSGLLKRLGLEQLDRMLPPLQQTRAVPDYHAAVGPERGQVALFTGCTGRLFDQNALWGAITLLSRCGYAVHVPPAQCCCGGLDQHAGEQQRFEQLARQNLAAFHDFDGPVLFLASGCGALLSEYDRWLQEPEAGAFATKVQEISAFLTTQLDDAGLTFAPLEQTVAVHLPCSQRNILRAPGSAAALLAHIPGLRLTTVGASAGSCCGAAGRYLVDFPDTAEALGSRLLDEVADGDARWLATTNVGCALHLAAGARARKLDLAIVHPVELLAQQLV